MSAWNIVWNIVTISVVALTWVLMLITTRLHKKTIRNKKRIIAMMYIANERMVETANAILASAGQRLLDPFPVPPGIDAELEEMRAELLERNARTAPKGMDTRRIW